MYNSVLTWRKEGTPPTQDSQGNILPGEPGEEVRASCRYENYRLGNRKEILGKDGESILALGRVYIKFGEPTPPRFFEGEIYTKDQLIYKGEILNTFEGQMNSTVYTIEDVRN